MAEQPDPKVSRRYRELGDEEPPRELDQAILAAAHRAADRPHAPLIAPAGRHRWYFAFGAAAIMVLAVAITVQLDRQQLDPEALPAASAPAVSERKETFADSKGEVSSKAEASSATPQAQEKARTNVQKQTVPSKPRSGPARDAAPLQEKPQAAEVARADRLEAQRQQPPAEIARLIEKQREVVDIQGRIVFRKIRIARIAENRFDKIEIADQAPRRKEANLHGLLRIGSRGGTNQRAQ